MNYVHNFDGLSFLILNIKSKLSILRVQHSLCWKKFCLKKENFLTLNSVSSSDFAVQKFPAEDLISSYAADSRPLYVILPNSLQRQSPKSRRFNAIKRSAMKETPLYPAMQSMKYPPPSPFFMREDSPPPSPFFQRADVPPPSPFFAMNYSEDAEDDLISVEGDKKKFTREVKKDVKD